MNRSPIAAEAVRDAIATLRSAVGNAAHGLPEEVFLLVSSLTPMINVDLLIRDGMGRNLLTWRHDAFYGPGWHIPGGIIRFKEKTSSRIAAVAAAELGANVRFDTTPLCINEITNPSRDIRGHFISLLYACTLTSAPDEARRCRDTPPEHGQWAWHAGAPEALIKVHEIYRPFLDTSPCASRLEQVPTQGS